VLFSAYTSKEETYSVAAMVEDDYLPPWFRYIRFLLFFFYQ